MPFIMKLISIDYKVSFDLNYGSCNLALSIFLTSLSSSINYFNDILDLFTWH